MKRRKFLISAAGASLAASISAPAIAKGKRHLKMVTTWSRDFPGVSTGAERFAKRINELSNGELTVEVFSAGELVPLLESFDAVASGQADMFHGSEHYWQGKSKTFNFFAALPFGMSAGEMNAWIQFGGGQRLWDELSASYNLKSFLVGNTGGQMGGWFNRQIKSTKDFSGLKISISGLGGEVLRRFKAASAPLPPEDILANLRSGTIDAGVWLGPWNDIALGLHKVAKYYYYPGFHEPGIALSAGINLKVWQSLSPSLQNVIQAAAEAENMALSAEFNTRNAEALEILIKKHKVKLLKFPNRVLRSLGEVSGHVVTEVGTTDALSNEIFKSFINFRSKAMGWTKYTEQAFWSARLLPFKYGVKKS